jgi:hypothetical protein
MSKAQIMRIYLNLLKYSITEKKFILLLNNTLTGTSGRKITLKSC